MIKPVFSLACSASCLIAGLPLPEASVRLVIPDVKAFDKALSGAYRQLLEGSLPAEDAVLASWKQTQVGSKLDAQWAAFTGKFSLDWKKLQAMQPSSIGLALLDVGHLEAVLVVETPLAIASFHLPMGSRKTYNGVAYTMVAEGTADGSDDQDQRMGLAFAQTSNKLILASSERALKLTIDASVSGKDYTPALEGLACLELNLDELRNNRYFKREFLFSESPEKGRLYAALRSQDGNLVEIRQGTGDSRSPVFRFDAGNDAIAGWEPDGSKFWPTFRRALLDPEPNPSPKPVPAIRPLPVPSGVVDGYITDFTKPKTGDGPNAWEEGDLAIWNSLSAKVSSYGYSSHPSGQRRLVFLWPEKQDTDFINACKTTMARRHGRATVRSVDGAQEIQVGPGLPVLAVRRTGAFLWAASSASQLKGVKTPSAETDLIRWAKLDLNAARSEEQRWEKAEGPQHSNSDRPLSDRVLGLLGWMPNTESISVERRKTNGGWTEKVVFGKGR
jgi:hypothetical protein